MWHLVLVVLTAPTYLKRSINIIDVAYDDYIISRIMPRLCDEKAYGMLIFPFTTETTYRNEVTISFD